MPGEKYKHQSSQKGIIKCGMRGDVSVSLEKMSKGKQTVKKELLCFAIEFVERSAHIRK